MTDPYIKQLKHDGHMLLNIYLSMDPDEPIRTKKKREAYTELQRRLKTKYNAHFGQMKTPHEIIHACAKLQKMIHDKEQKLLRRSKIQFAPNLMELQAQANNLNPHLRK